MKKQAHWQSVVGQVGQRSIMNIITKLAFGTLVAASLAACNQNLPEVLDFGDEIVNEAGTVVAKIPGVVPTGEPIEVIPDTEIAIKWVFPSSFPKACNTNANIVQNPKFMVSTGAGNIPPATIVPWSQAAGTPQLGTVMGHGNPNFAQMWGYLDSGEAIKQTVPFGAVAYEVYFSAKQFNTTTSPVPLRVHLKTSVGATNPWVAPDINIPATATTWTMYGPFTITPVAGANTLTLASSNLTPTAQAQPKTVSWGQYDNVCILRKETVPFDLEIKKDLKTKPAQNGQANSYILNVTNLGLGTSSAPITITDNLPAGVTITGTPIATPASAGFTCTTAVVCTSSTPMAVGASVQIVIPVTVNQNQGMLENCATVQAVGDTNPQNDRACVATDVIPGKPVDIAIRKQLLGATSLPAGGIGTYKLNVLNLGGAIGAGPIMVLDAMPAGLTLVTGSISPIPAADWNCAASTSTLLSCTYAGSFAVPTGYSSTLQFNVQVAGGFVGSVKNCAKVTVAADTVLGNNVSCIKNPIKNQVISDPFELALTDAMTQLEDYLETLPDDTQAKTKATSGLKDTLKTQVRLMPGTTFEPLSDGDNVFNAIYVEGGVTERIKVKIECSISYPPLKASCSITITL